MCAGKGQPAGLSLRFGAPPLHLQNRQVRAGQCVRERHMCEDVAQHCPEAKPEPSPVPAPVTKQTLSLRQSWEGTCPGPQATAGTVVGQSQERSVLVAPQGTGLTPPWGGLSADRSGRREAAPVPARSFAWKFHPMRARRPVQAEPSALAGRPRSPRTQAPLGGRDGSPLPDRRCFVPLCHVGRLA